MVKIVDMTSALQQVREKAPDTADAMKRHKAGNAGFTDKAHLKAKGLIPRADGTKKKSDKYEDLDKDGYANRIRRTLGENDVPVRSCSRSQHCFAYCAYRNDKFVTCSV